MIVLQDKKKAIARRLALALLMPFGFLIMLTEAISQESLFPASSSPTGWSPAPSVLRPTGFSAHSLVMIGDDLYLIGGAYGPSNGTISVVYSDIYHAHVQSNGYITGWNRIGDYPLVKAAYAGTTVDDNGTVYVTGGLKDPWNYTSDTRCTTPINGTISQWKLASVTTSFSARYGHAASIVGDKLYVLGGMGSAPLTDVSYATIDSAQCLTTDSWTSTLALEPPTGRLGHAALEFEGRIYIIGGLTLAGGNYVPLASVYFAHPTGTGAIPQWIETEALLHELAYPAAFVVSPTRKIYVMGGWTGGEVITNVVYSAYINQDGTLAEWEEESLHLPHSLHRHSAVVGDSGGVYLVGGQRTRRDDYINNTYYIPPLTLTKSNDPTGPVHEGDLITYTISYANTSLITQTMSITDVLPFNITLVPGSVSPPVTPQGSTLVWNLGNVPPGGSGEVSFQVRVALLPSLHRESVTTLGLPEPPPARVLPVSIACDTTRFWANGVTRQPPEPNPHTIQVQIPPDTSPSAMWLAVKGTNDIYLTVDGTQATRIATSDNQIGASLWSAPVTPDAVASGVVTVVTGSPRQLNALFLFDKDDPPFDKAALDDFYNTTKTFTYTLEMPSVVTQTMDVILPFMDITYWTDDLLPDTRMTEITVEFDGQSHTVVANDPNLGNGLLMTQFPFTIGPFSDTITSTKVLTVTVDTEDSVYTLGPRVCRPVYIENTAWLCSQQAGCISDTATNIPEDLVRPGAGGLYLPIILKSHP